MIRINICKMSKCKYESCEIQSLSNTYIEKEISSCHWVKEKVVIDRASPLIVCFLITNSIFGPM